MKKIMIITSIMVLTIFTATTVFAKSYNTRVRVIHASPDAPPVDILVNDEILAFSGVEFNEVTDYVDLMPGSYNFKVVPEGGTPADAVIDVDATLFPNRDYTVIATNTLDSIEPILLMDRNRPVSVRKASVRFFHGSPDAPAVDIRVVDGPYLFEDVGFQETGYYLTVPAGMYDLEVLVTGTEIVALTIPGVMLEGGTTYSAIATGLLTGPPDLSALLTIDAENKAKFRARMK
jgi:hypothetical protein